MDTNKIYIDKKILLCSNDLTLCTLIKVQLSLSGFTVVIPKNKEDILNIIREENNLRLIIIGMVNTSCSEGLNLLESIRENKAFDKFPILTICDYKYDTEETNPFSIFSKGSDLVVKTPLDNMDFLIKVKSLVRRCDLFFKLFEKEDKLLTKNYLNNKVFVFINNKKIFFTPIEKDIFLYMYNKSDRIITTEELLINVFKYPKGTGNPDTIRVHIKNIREKIENNKTKPEILVHIAKRGYILNKDICMITIIEEN